MSLSFGSSKTKTNQKSKTDPYAPTIPFLKDFIGGIPTAQTAGLTGDGQAAVNALKTSAAGGDPSAVQIRQLTDNLFDTPNRSGEATSAVSDLERRLAPTADGPVDLEANPFIQKMLAQNSDSVAARINSMFAGAGRDLSGVNQQSVARGVSEATLPVLAQLFQSETGRKDAAARDLFQGQTGGAQAAAGLDESSARLRALGIDTSQAALDAENYTPERILELERFAQEAELGDLGKIAQLLYGAAGLGQDTKGSGTSKTSGFGLGMKLI